MTWQGEEAGEEGFFFFFFSNHHNIRFKTADKCSCTYAPPAEAICLKGRYLMEKRDLWKSVARSPLCWPNLEHPRPLLHELTLHQRRKHVFFCHITSLGGNGGISLLYFINILKVLLQFCANPKWRRLLTTDPAGSKEI